MNVFYGGHLFFNIKIEDVSCFSFCEHFYKAFFKKELIKQTSVIQPHPHEEVITYCIDCKKKIIQFARSSIVFPTTFSTRQRKI